MIAAASALVLAVSAAGCAEDSKKGSDSAVTTTAREAKAAPGKVELKKYEFPEFLGSIKVPDMLSNAVYVSFDAGSYSQPVEEQPFEGYECTQLINDTLYVFKQGKFSGLLDMSGKVVLEADTYAEIEPCSQGMLTLSRNKELNSPDDYAYFDESGNITPAENYAYSSEDIVTEVQSVLTEGDGDSEAVYKDIYDLKLPGGSYVTDGAGLGGWDSVEEISAESIVTSKVFSGYYRAVKDSSYYFICIDRFYNYTVYNGAYGFVRLKVGDVYGECYILDSSDYNELDQMIKSFGSSGTAQTPSSDTGLDFIQIETGLSTGEKTVITVSADGYCFTDAVSTSGDQPVNKYFSKLDKESFISLVQWVDQVLSKEYAQINEQYCSPN